MRRVLPACLGALACVLAIGAGPSGAQEEIQDPAPTTTTSPPNYLTTTTSTTTTTVATTTTTQRSGTSSPTTAAGSGGRPVPPPAAGPTQTLVPDLVGTPLEATTSTSSVEPFFPSESFTPTTLTTGTATATISSSRSPSGATLALAAVAWLASFGGVLVYAEDRRASQWKHLAR